jgi:hypothetical protein
VPGRQRQLDQAEGAEPVAVDQPAAVPTGQATAGDSPAPEATQATTEPARPSEEPVQDSATPAASQELSGQELADEELADEELAGVDGTAEPAAVSVSEQESAGGFFTPASDAVVTPAPGPAPVEQAGLEPEPGPQAPGPPAAAGQTRLLGSVDATGFQGRWTQVQASFVDDPRQAVEQADSLVGELLEQVARAIGEERGKLGEWRHGDPSTEDLRLVLRGYRDFCRRLLKVAI